ncbi:MAG: hemolysin family protein [Treponema sp.]|jgi:putative hemolysin|nr:hemolysin family protein [Treponema sp.]
MEDGILWQLLLQFALIMVNAVFACAEIALLSVNETKLEQLAAGGDKRAVRLLSLTGEPAKFLATIQVGITLAGFLGSAFAADNFSEKLVDALLWLGLPFTVATLDAISVVCITVILSFFTLVLGELVPKRLAMQKAEQLAFAMSGFIALVSRIFTPVVWLLTRSTNMLLRLLRIDPNAADEEITEEGIRLLVDAGSEKGAIDEREQEIIHNVFEFDDKTAGEVMTHRLDTVFLWLDDSDEVWERIIIKNRFSYYPICRHSCDDITSILSVKEYLYLKDRSRQSVLHQAIQPAQFVPSSVKTNVLFKNMKSKRNHFAVVLDEYGGMNGIITMSDLLEELVGDLENDNTMPPEKPLIEQLSPLAWRVSGAASLDKLAAACNLPLPVDDYDTVSGFVFSLLGRIPEDGETTTLEAYGLHIDLQKIQDHRLETALISRNAPAERP